MKPAVIALIVALVATPLMAQRRPAAPQQPALGSDIATKTLENGMKIIVWPDHDIPNVAMYTWYRAGSRNEVPGITGLSHFFEHMMFNGSEKYGPGEFDRVMEAAGGSNNAYAADDVTVYQNWFPRSALELIFDLEADRMQNLALDPEMVQSEREVVYSERRLRIDNNNFGLLREQVQATAFIAHPYGQSGMGWPSDIESWTMEDLQSFYRTYYAPNNATMIVVGAVTPAEIFALAEKYFAPIPAQDPPAPVRTIEPRQLGERRVTVEKEAQVPLLQTVFHIGPATDPRSEALDLLMAILTGGDSSRLHRRLVDQERIAIDVDGWRPSAMDPTLLWLSTTLTPDADVARAEAILNEELARVVENGVTAEELQKAKNISVANFWRTLKTINGKAQALGSFETYQGDYARLFTAPQRYEAVTREQIQEAASQIFTRTNRTVGLLLPQPPAPATGEESR
jgi:zinc protease